MHNFVTDPTLPIKTMFCDYKEMGMDDLMWQKYQVHVMSYYLEVQSNLTSYLGRPPTVDEWACSLNVAVNELKSSILQSQEAQSALITRHGGLVRTIALSYRGHGVPFRDLIQEGSCGLIYAAERFDPAQGHKFTTYAVHWIRKHVSRCVASHSRMIRLPQRVHEKVVTMNRVKAMMSATLGREPSLEEVAQHTKVRLNPTKAKSYEVAARRISSLDATTKAASAPAAATLGDLVVDLSSPGPEEHADKALLRAELAVLLSSLPEMEREVIELRFGLKDGQPKGYEEVIEALKRPELTTKREVVNTEDRAFYKLRKPSTIAKMLEIKEALFIRSSGSSR